MKKIYTTLLGVIAIAHFSHAQNSVSWPSNGPVGIGTTTPGNNLGFQNVNSDSGAPGITWYNPSPLDYGIHRTAGDWVSPNYQQLRLRWSTGIVLDPGTSYGKSYVDVAGSGLRVTSGSLGVGVASTLSKLQVGSGTSNAGSTIAMLSGAVPGGAVNALSLVNNAGAATGNEVAMTFHTAGNYSPTGKIAAIAQAVQPTTDMAFSTYDNQSGLVERMRILGNGSVGIGTSTPDAAFKLSVNGSVRAKEVKVETNWSDYVFDKGYLLRPIGEVEAYIKKNHHLPDIPTAAEVAKNGINVSETNSLLLKKIEELTLYLIEKDKELKQQQLKYKAQQLKINQQDSRLRKLERSLASN